MTHGCLLGCHYNLSRGSLCIIIKMNNGSSGMCCQAKMHTHICIVRASGSMAWLSRLVVEWMTWQHQQFRLASEGDAMLTVHTSDFNASAHSLHSDLLSFLQLPLHSAELQKVRAQPPQQLHCPISANADTRRVHVDSQECTCNFHPHLVIS